MALPYVMILCARRYSADLYSRETAGIVSLDVNGSDSRWQPRLSGFKTGLPVIRDMVYGLLAIYSVALAITGDIGASHIEPKAWDSSLYP